MTEPEKRKTVSANLTVSTEAHRKMRMLAQRTGLTNSEVVGTLLEVMNLDEAERKLSPKVNEKAQLKAQRKQLAKEVQAMSPDKVKKILASLKKESEDS